MTIDQDEALVLLASKATEIRSHINGMADAGHFDTVAWAEVLEHAKRAVHLCALAKSFAGDAEQDAMVKELSSRILGHKSADAGQLRGNYNIGIKP